MNKKILILAAAKLSSEALRGLKRSSCGEGTRPAPLKPGEWLQPGHLASPPAVTNSKPVCHPGRLVFACILPGRWVRCTGAAVVSACLWLAGAAFATQRSDSFHAANTAFAQGKFEEAARGFESILAQNGYSAPALYNLANAQFQAGQVGSAILNYERALALAPRDPDIAANLERARAKAGLPAPHPALLSRSVQALNLNGWGTLAAGAFAAGCLVVVLQRRLPRIRASLRLTCALAAIVFVGASSALALRWPELDRAIVTDRDCTARVAPVSMGEVSFKLAEGDTVWLKKRHGDYALVECRDGRAGWVKQDGMKQVLVESPPNPRHQL